MARLCSVMSETSDGKTEWLGLDDLKAGLSRACGPSTHSKTSQMALFRARQHGSCIQRGESGG